MNRLKLSWLNLLTHAGAALPLIVLVWDYYRDNLTVNWIQAVEQRTGFIALNLLVLSLAVTPVTTITAYRPIHYIRRPLGVWAFGYAALHFFTFSVIDYGLDFGLLQEAIFEKPYALVGFLAFLILVPLAATSWKWWKKKLGKRWKKLHQMVYAAGGLVIIHYAWVVKGDVLSLQGNIILPVVYGIVVALLFAMRIPAVRKQITHWRTGVQGWMQARRRLPG
jgi:sulfoxide reductase heme-binding subunit YedZ